MSKTAGSRRAAVGFVHRVVSEIPRKFLAPEARRFSVGSRDGTRDVLGRAGLLTLD